MRSYFSKHPLRTLLLLALILRLVSVVFSKGYAMHDDHYLIIEAPGSWIDGFDYNNWKPENNGGKPEGHSLFYVGSQYGLMWVCEKAGVEDPQHQMYFIRLIHALFSLLMIFCAYRITQRIGTDKDALIVGLLMAAFWPMPFLSVRNLIEFVCITPIIGASYLLVTNGPDHKWTIVWTALLCGLAMGVRFQLAFFIAGWGLAYLLTGRWMKGLGYGIFAALGYVLSQMGDLIWWDYPLTEIRAYVDYNIINSTSYFDRPWYQYIFTLVGILIPPFSIFLLFGAGRMWKRWIFLFMPAFIFLLVHSVIPNKQERFILPILPYIFILGVVGFREFKERSSFWEKRRALWKGLLTFGLTLNIMALCVLTVTYSKRSRVESMYYLYKQDDFRNFFMDYSHRDGYLQYPQYYSQQWQAYLRITKTEHCGVWTEKHMPYIKEHWPEKVPNYVLFLEPDNLESRIAAFEGCFGEIEHVKTIRPGNFDRLLHWLNPHNRYEGVEVYRIKNL